MEDGDIEKFLTSTHEENTAIGRAIVEQQGLLSSKFAEELLLSVICNYDVLSKIDQSHKEWVLKVASTYGLDYRDYILKKYQNTTT